MQPIPTTPTPAKVFRFRRPQIPTPASPIEKEAQSAAMAELQKHWVKGADGWTTARVSGSAYAPDHFLRQFKTLTAHNVEVALI